MRLIVLAFIMALAACASSPGATAQPTADANTSACVIEAGNDATAQRACIGRQTEQCIAATEGGETTVGMVRCAQVEARAWEALRDEKVAAFRQSETPTQIALLNAALEQHAAWAQARCAYEASVYEGGSLAHVVGAACMRDAAAEFAISLLNRHAEP